MKRVAAVLMVALAVVAITLPAAADQGTVVKWSQPIGHLINPQDPSLHGENIASDVDWVNVMNNPTFPAEPNWIVADDFQDPFDTPVLTVRWWGSYLGDPNDPAGPTGGTLDPSGAPIFGPGSEDGYVLSFFTDIPATPGGPPFSMPGELLGTYVAPLPAVRIKSTPYVGWDDHEIWEYEVNLQDTHLEHPHSTGIAEPFFFHQEPDTIYWLAINAQVGHDIEPATWESIPTGKRANPNNGLGGHFWGWHTAPKVEPPPDDAVMGHLVMPGNDWIYQQWNPIQPQHGLRNMAFELLTIPEPASVALFAPVLALLIKRRR